MTPAQFARAIGQIEHNLKNAESLMKNFAQRYRGVMQRNLAKGINANNTPMAPLSKLTRAGRITQKDGSPGSFRRDFGERPLIATGEMLRNLKFKSDGSGWIVFVENEIKRRISFWQGNVPTGEDLVIKPRAKSARAMASAMAKKGMYVSAKTAAKGFRRPARLPFALNKQHVRVSVKDLNRLILEPLARFR